MRRQKLKHFARMPAGLLGALITGLAACTTGDPLAGSLPDRLDTARRANEASAMGLVVANGHGRYEVVVSGYRTSADAVPVEQDDAWHIGSNTKALTALLFARLVTEGLAHWDQTVPELFPDLAGDIDPAWQTVTMRDFLAHRAGLGEVPLDVRISDESSLVALRQATAERFLTVPPEHDLGAFRYSNLGYLIAGAAIESILHRNAVTPMSWEDAMHAFVFSQASNPDARSGWGFGPPDRIEGHHDPVFGTPKPAGKGDNADNHPVFGPAGTIHAPLVAHALLLTEFLRSESPFLPEAQKTILWSAYPDTTSDYALGWSLETHPDYGPIYWHAGSNTLWRSYVAIAPDRDRVVIINANIASEAYFRELAFDLIGQPDHVLVSP